MKPPILYRKGIPLFYEKTETDYQKDPYERYNSMVLRQVALHLADGLWGRYPMQAVLDFAQAHYPAVVPKTILEIGCSVGRWIGGLAQACPTAKCWGIDYSYQMLRQATAFWIQGKAVSIDLRTKGFSDKLELEGHQLRNLQFGLAKAANLPFDDNSQDLVLSSFLLDRIDNPTKGLLEMKRVLRVGGRLILITPLNFSQVTHWETYHPPAKIYTLLTQMGFQILDWKEDVTIHEPLDAHGNIVTWKCLGCAAVKTG